MCARVLPDDDNNLECKLMHPYLIAAVLVCNCLCPTLCNYCSIRRVVVAMAYKQNVTYHSVFGISATHMHFFSPLGKSCRKGYMFYRP